MGCVCANLACLKTESKFKCCVADVLDVIASFPCTLPLSGFPAPYPHLAGASNIYQLAKKGYNPLIINFYANTLSM